MDDFNDLFAFKPEGNFILTFKNEDRPGAISEVINVYLNDMMRFYWPVIKMYSKWGS